MSEITEHKQETKFQPGKSGNPAGRPAGARNRATLAMEALLDGEAEELTRKAIELAKAGDTVALRLCMERILPARRDRPVSFKLPDMTKASEAVLVSAALIQSVANGTISPGEAVEVGRLLDIHVKTIETAQLEERMERLERMTR